MADNRLYYGDNLDVLRRYVPDGSVDLVYLDPPFNSNATYNVLFAEQDGKQSSAQLQAFEDSWRWDESAVTIFQATVKKGGPVSDALRAFYTLLGDSNMMAYLAMMAPRLVELHRVLTPTGSLYLHCDSTASHYLKLLLDAIFDPRRFLNEITWKRTTAHNDPNRYGRVQDRILFYSKGPTKTFNRLGGTFSPEQMARYKYTAADGRRYRAENLTAPHYSPTRTVEWRGQHPGRDRQWRYGLVELDELWANGRILTTRDGRPRKDGLIEYLDEAKAVGPALQDLWTDIALGPTSAERLGYPTQKPVALLERIIGTSTNLGDVVLDPFCGCGTAIDAAQKLGRHWIGIDVTHLAITLIKKRLLDTYGDEITASYTVIGEPTTEQDANMLALQDRYQFQWWALGLVGARLAEVKKGSDKGIDGRLFFYDDQSAAKQVILSVKSGKVTADDVRVLRSVVEREHAAIGALLTLEPPTRDMRTEAVGAGHYWSEGWQTEHPRLQIVTIAELLAGKKLDYPFTGQRGATFRPAPRAKVAGGRQGALPLGG